MSRNRGALRATITTLVLTGASWAGLGGTAPVVHATTPRLVLPLSVVGNRIQDGQGHDLVLRGLQRAGTEVGAGTSPTPVSATELQAMGSGMWNANVIRVPVGSAQWTGACPTLFSDS